MRLDKFLKVSRLIKRRTVANEACDAGRVLVNGKSAKASLNVKAGDVIEIQLGTRNVKAEVLDVQEDVYKRQEHGCPWDREQTYESLKPCMVNEMVEALAAIDLLSKTGNGDNLCEELGDVLLQIVLLARIAQEEGR